MKHLVLFLFSSPHPLYLSYLSNKLICDFYIIFVKRQYLKKKLVVAFLFDLSGTFCPVFMQIFHCNKLYVPLRDSCFKYI